MPKKRKRHRPEEIVAKLKQAESLLQAGHKVNQVVQELGISEATYSRWKNEFGGMNPAEAVRIKALEEENRRLRRLAADMALDIRLLKHVIEDEDT